MSRDRPLRRGRQVECLSRCLHAGNTGWTLRWAWTINNAGQIAGQGWDADGNLNGFLLTPIATRLSLADTDVDGVVDPVDLVDVLARWGTSAVFSEDVDGDGRVGFAELLALLRDSGVQYRKGRLR